MRKIASKGMLQPKYWHQMNQTIDSIAKFCGITLKTLFG